MQSCPRVLILGLNFPPERTGIAPYTGTLAVGLRKIGYRVRAVVAHPHYPEWAISAGYGKWSQVEHLCGVRVDRLLHYVPRSPRGLRRLVSELTFGVRLLLARWGKPDVIITVSPSLFSSALAALRVRLMRRRPALITWVQDIYTLGMQETGEGGQLVRQITRWVESWTLRVSDRVVVIHPRFKDYVSQELRVPPARVIVIRNWTHLPPAPAIAADEAKRALGWPTGFILAVHTGNMGAKQGLRNVVEAARLADERAAPVHFVLVGDGAERHALEELSSGISRLTFVAPLGDADYRLALKAADVLVVNEEMGVAAMAVPSKLTSYFDAGRPVVAATDSHGITAAEVTDSGGGIVVPAGKPDKLLDALLAIGSDSECAARLGRNGRRYREATLNQDVAIEQWNDLIAAVRLELGSI
ncbi:glycosyltransferase [Mycolicibacterium austroafricanum]|uniref:glycosyltransferase n=1 Tax=Mycolicibacterium austroafricanum TaxID=39687 RepID=UPI001ABF1D5F|nr:glycosyltransferase [Mycolicibacterium austroafricanum]QRZ09800.1 glycosyltransferase [Mycolicibacterium austroafricanum]QZT71246.1 glycosyltransferase [Mycolicibacterium austroafricanum]